jgi:hypothetical protein
MREHRRDAGHGQLLAYVERASARASSPVGLKPGHQRNAPANRRQGDEGSGDERGVEAAIRRWPRR